MMKKIYISVLFFIFLFSACVEPYNPEFKEYLNLLVVNGKITDEPGPYSIELTRTSDLNNPMKISENEALVIIYDNQGNSEILKEISSGLYQTSENGIQGIIGRKYKLYIKTKDNQEYETEFSELLPPIEVDSLYGIYDNQQTEDSYLTHEGYQFYIKSHTVSDETTFLFWEVVETYEYNAGFPIEEYYDTRKREFKPYPNPYEFYTCYKTNLVKNIFCIETENNNTFIHPLFFASADQNKKLSIKYSILVNQYHTNQENYTYLKNLKDILSQGDSFYNIQPFQISGNIKNKNNPSEPVPGYFTVASVTHKRIFVPPIQATNYYDWCVPNIDYYGKILAYGSRTIQYATRDNDGNMGIIGGSCIDCRLNGGSLEKPVYWNEN